MSVMQLQWWTFMANRLRFRLGWPGMAAIAATTVALLMAKSMWQLQADVGELEQQLQTAELQRPAKVQVVLTPEDTLAQELSTFSQRFPGVEKLPDLLGVMFRLAEGYGLQVVQGEYSLTEKRQGHVRRFEATVPVQGNYKAVKGLILDMLQAMPNVALAELSFERGEAAEAEIKTRLRLVFFIRKGA